MKTIENIKIRYFRSKTNLHEIWALKPDGREKLVYDSLDKDINTYDLVWTFPEGYEPLEVLVEHGTWEEITEEEAFLEMI